MKKLCLLYFVILGYIFPTDGLMSYYPYCNVACNCECLNKNVTYRMNYKESYCLRVMAGSFIVYDNKTKIQQLSYSVGYKVMTTYEYTELCNIDFKTPFMGISDNIKCPSGKICSDYLAVISCENYDSCEFIVSMRPAPSNSTLSVCQLKQYG